MLWFKPNFFCCCCITLWCFCVSYGFLISQKWNFPKRAKKINLWHTLLLWRHCHVIEHSIEASNGKFKYVVRVCVFYFQHIHYNLIVPTSKQNQMKWKIKQLNAETKQIIRLIYCCFSSAFKYSSISCIE